jgi:hypothetical protein
MQSHVEVMRQFAREVGRLSGRYEFAEGWRRHHYAGFCDPQSDPLRGALGID